MKFKIRALSLRFSYKLLFLVKCHLTWLVEKMRHMSSIYNLHCTLISSEFFPSANKNLEEKNQHKTSVQSKMIS